MAAEETFPYGRSSSRASRVVQDTTLEQRSFFGHRSSKKSQQKAASDKLVWFSPVHSPLLSPAREKTLQTARKKVRNSSIFSIQSRAKGSIEAEEPTSPKVSCIGQVRAYKKDKDPFADTNKKKTLPSKPGSMSPARFFASPARTSKWGSLFGSRKDSCATPTSSGYGGGEVSCFGSPFDSRSMYQSDRTCAFLAKSLILLQECGNLDASSNNKAISLCTHASDYQPEKQGTQAAVDGYFDRYTHDEADSHVFGEARAFAAANHDISPKKGASAYEKTYDWNVQEKRNNGQNSIMHVEPNDADKHAGPEKSFQEQRCHGKPPASKQRLKYEELPSLHCGPSIKPNMKISVEVVPETWLWRNGERLRPDSTSQLTCVPERNSSTSTSREDLQGAHEKEITIPVSPCSTAQPYIGEGEGCTDCQVSQNVHAEDNSDFVSVDAGLVPVDNTTCKPLYVDSETKNDTQLTRADEASVSLPSCTSMGARKEDSMELRSSGNEDGAYGSQVDKHQALHGEKLKNGVDVEKHQIFLGSSELKNRHRRLRRVGPDVGKENCGITLPQLLEKKLPSVHSNEDGKHLWSIFKGRKSDAFSAQPFSALILVGYDQPIASKDNAQKVTHDEELLKGILEVGRLSFHGAGKYFQVLKGDAEFIRSRSATSHRTVITLQRCNSDPCRPSY